MVVIILQHFCCTTSKPRFCFLQQTNIPTLCTCRQTIVGRRTKILPYFVYLECSFWKGKFLLYVPDVSAFSEKFIFTVFLQDIHMRTLTNPFLLGTLIIGKEDLDHQQKFQHFWTGHMANVQDQIGRWFKQCMVSKMFLNHVWHPYLDIQKQEHSGSSNMRIILPCSIRNLLWMWSGKDFQTTTLEEFYCSVMFHPLPLLLMPNLQSHWTSKCWRPSWNVVLWCIPYLLKVHPISVLFFKVPFYHFLRVSSPAYPLVANFF